MQTGLRYAFVFFIIFIVLVVIWFGQKLIASTQQSSSNVILISVDTLRADHMGVYGYDRNTTPRIDAWAKNATVYTNHRTVVPMTYPSFSALLSGRDPLKSRLVSNGSGLMSDTTVTLPKILKLHGYDTASFISGVPPYLLPGFDYRQFYSFKYFYIDKEIEYYNQTSREGYEKYLNNSISWIQKNKNKKFFLWVHLMDPHAPYWPPDSKKCLFLDKELCDHVKSQTNQLQEKERAQRQFCQNTPMPKDLVALEKGLYDAGVLYSDSFVGKILDTIKAEGLDKNSIVIFYSDHGEGFDHNYYFNHRDVVFDSAIHTPLIIKDPGQTVGRKDDTFLSNLDVLPTILDKLNISYDNFPFDGKSIISKVPFPFNLFQEKKYIYGMNSKLTKFYIMDGKYKYIYSLSVSCVNNNKLEELYDIPNDPKELHEISKDYPDIVKDLKTRLLYYLSSYNLPKKFQSKPPSAFLDEDDVKQQKSTTDKDAKLDDLKSLQY